MREILLREAPGPDQLFEGMPIVHIIRISEISLSKLQIVKADGIVTKVEVGTEILRSVKNPGAVVFQELISITRINQVVRTLAIQHHLVTA
jgi:hypothetical protein